MPVEHIEAQQCQLLSSDSDQDAKSTEHLPGLAPLKVKGTLSNVDQGTILPQFIKVRIVFCKQARDEVMAPGQNKQCCNFGFEG